MFGAGHPARKKPLTAIVKDGIGHTEVSRGHSRQIYVGEHRFGEGLNNNLGRKRRNRRYA